MRDPGFRAAPLRSIRGLRATALKRREFQLLAGKLAGETELSVAACSHIAFKSAGFDCFVRFEYCE
jgi:hypothetical protein